MEAAGAARTLHLVVWPERLIRWKAVGAVCRRSGWTRCSRAAKPPAGDQISAGKKLVTALGACWSLRGGPEPRGACERILAAQAVYAPDAPVSRDEAELALGRRLFRLLPEDRFDRGPATGGGGRWTLVADIRLDDRDSLCAELGIEARAMSDAAVAMSAVERWQEDAIARLVGDFALILWDRDRRRLHLARDFLGLRPLHYHLGRNFVAAASMPRGLHALAEVPYGVDEGKVAEFLALMPERGPATFFEGISRVEPGQIVTVEADGAVSAREHWRFEPLSLGVKSAPEWAEAVRAMFETSVAARLRGAEAGVGAQLSGGIDSGAVVATAARLLGDAKLTALTAVPREGAEIAVPRGRFGDEGPHAAAVAALHPNVEHVLIRSGARSPFEALDRNFFLHQRPVLNLCNAVWGDAIFEEMKRRKLPILLTGHMGNATISYRGAEGLAVLLGRGRLLKVAREAVALKRSGSGLLNILSGVLGPFVPRRAWLLINSLAGRRYAIGDYSMIRAERARALQAEAERRALDFTYRPGRDPVGSRLWMLRRLDFGNSRKAALGGWGVDVRDPTADRRLVELCLSIPVEHYLSGGVDRAIARRAFADRLPSKVIEERRSGYQAADWHEGLAAAGGALAEEIARIADAPGASDLLDTETMAARGSSLPKGGWNGHETQAHYRLALLRGVSAGHFFRRAKGSN
jgi:asparagine synthase (glutamine-hydrolysing)